MYLGTGLFSCISSPRALDHLQSALVILTQSGKTYVLYASAGCHAFLYCTMLPERNMQCHKKRTAKELQLKLVFLTKIRGRAQQVQPRMPDRKNPRSVPSDEPKQRTGMLSASVGNSNEIGDPISHT